ncbi:thioredoxin family protein [Candidatus Dojkabacteria bacterium]|nr:thioredoxin family protein [Candidatus Dojkabacteria bacterium]
MAKKQKGKQQDSEPSVIELSVPDNFGAFATPIAIILSAVIVSAAVIYAGSKLDGSSNTLGAEDTSNNSSADDSGTTGDNTEEPGEIVRAYETFTEYDTDICKDDGKPIVYLFSTTWCSHCQWIADTFDKWAKDNSDKVKAYHWQIDTGDNTLTDKEETEIPQEHMDVYEKFNPGGSIPTFVFGCRYSRIGNGYESEDDLDKEIDSFDKVIDELI